MSKGAWGVALILAGLLAAGAAWAQSTEAEREAAQIRETAREYVQLFFVADFEQLHAKFTDEMKESMDLEALRAMRWNVEEKLGKETEVLDEIVEASGEYVLYLRRAKFEKFGGAMDGRWILRNGQIAGLEFRPAK